MGTIGTLTELVKNNFPILTNDHLESGCRYLVVDLSGINVFPILLQTLIKYVEYLLEKIESLPEMFLKKIETFTIGKTYAKTKIKYRHDFNGGNSDHFTKTGISERFRHTYKEEGYDFLIGIVILTRSNIPPGAPPPFNKQQSLTLALESQLIQHFVYVNPDNRIGNTSLHPGNQSQQYAGGVIYLAVKTCPNFQYVH